MFSSYPDFEKDIDSLRKKYGWEFWSHLEMWCNDHDHALIECEE